MNMKRLQQLSGKDWIITILVFVLVLLSSSLLMLIDETPMETVAPWFIWSFAIIGFALAMVVNYPIIIMIHLINALSNKEIIPYDSWFTILPFATAIFWSFVTILLLLGVQKKTKK